MPTYISLVNRTDQGVKNIRGTVEWLGRGTEVAEKHGVRLG